MAQAGLEVRSGKALIIDQNYMNLYLSRKIAITEAGTTTGTFEEGEIIAAVGGVDGADIDAFCENNGSGYTCYVKGYQAGLQIYVFSMKQPKRKKGCGLQIFNSTGQLVYDSGNEYAKVLISEANSEEQIPKNKKVAIMLGFPTRKIDTTYDTSTGSHQEMQTVHHSAVTHTEWQTKYKKDLQLVKVPYQEMVQVPYQEWDPLTKTYVTKYRYEFQTKYKEEYQWVDVPYQELVTVVDKEAYDEIVWVTVKDTYGTSTVWEHFINYKIKDRKIVSVERAKNELASKTELVASNVDPWSAPISTWGDIWLQDRYYKSNPYTYTTSTDVATFLVIDVTNL